MKNPAFYYVGLGMIAVTLLMVTQSPVVEVIEIIIRKRLIYTKCDLIPLKHDV
jgi:hypothetical protein